MDKTTIINVQDAMGNAYGKMRDILHYIETTEAAHPLNEKELYLKRQLMAMQSIAAETIQMIDMEMQ